MKTYLIVGTLYYRIIEAKSSSEALAEYYCESAEIADIIFGREDLRILLIIRGYKTISQTGHKEVFLVKK